MISENLGNEDGFKITVVNREEYRHFIYTSNNPSLIYEYLCHVKDHRAKQALIESTHENRDRYLYKYCRGIHDDVDVRTALANTRRNSLWEWMVYCINVKERPELIYRIANSNHPRAAQYLYSLCEAIRSELARKLLAKVNAPDASYWRYRYCFVVKDDPEMTRAIAHSLDEESPRAQFLYCYNIADRPIVRKALARNPLPSAQYWRDRYCVEVRDRPEMHQ